MSNKKQLEFDCIAGSQVRDTQGEMLDVAGADISHLEQGLGLWNDNHGAGYFNTLGRITSAKKIFKAEDCENDRQRYYWEKVKSPYIYARGYMFDDDHPNAKAAAAILRNIHNTDSPLKLKASVEGGVIARGINDSSLLARTKITKVAITFTPANNATLVEPLNLDKSSTWEQDEILIKSVMHLAKTDIPSFRHITRYASAEKIVDNFNKIRSIAKEAGLKTQLPEYTADGLVREAVLEKVAGNVNKINTLISTLSKGRIIPGTTEDVFPKTLGAMKLDGDDVATMRHHQQLHQAAALKDPTHSGRLYHQGQIKEIDDHIAKLNKALTAGYGGAGAPGSLTGGSVIQTEALDDGRDLKYITCNNCGKEGVYMKHQVRCRSCNQHYPMSTLYGVMVKK